MKDTTRQMIASYCEALLISVEHPQTDSETVASSLRGVANMIEKMEANEAEKAERAA